MNQVATTDQKAAKPPAKALTPGGALAAFVPQDSAQLFKLAETLAQSGDMIPKTFQGNPNAIVAAIMRGMEIGLAPIQSLASIAVINGRASLWGDALPALMQRAGHHVDVEYEGAGDAMTAIATLTRGDTGKRVVRTFSMADAKRAGLLGKAGDEMIPLLNGGRGSIMALKEDVSQAGEFLARAAIQAIREPDLPPLQGLDVPRSLG